MLSHMCASVQQQLLGALSTAASSRYHLLWCKREIALTEVAAAPTTPSCARTCLQLHAADLLALLALLPPLPEGGPLQ